MSKSLLPSSAALKFILRPVAHFCMRRSIKIQDLNEGLKTALVEAAAAEIERIGERPSVSKISVMTGVHRADVQRLFGLEPNEKPSTNLLTRIIGLWQTHPRFLGSNGKPKVLSLEAKRGEFADMVAMVSSELSPYTILFEMERLGAASRTEAGVKLLVKEMNFSKDQQKSFEHLGQDMDYLIQAVSQNTEDKLEVQNLHLRTEFNNISSKQSDRIRNWLIKEGSKFHQRAFKLFSSLDRDNNPSIKDKSPPIKASIVSFSVISDIDDSSPVKSVTVKDNEK